jgi:hypothetical protein
VAGSRADGKMIYPMLHDQSTLRVFEGPEYPLLSANWDGGAHVVDG